MSCLRLACVCLIIFGTGLGGISLPLRPAGAESTQPQADKDQAKVEYSEAQKALFMTPHLDNIREANRSLKYEFRRKTEKSESFVDQVTVTITEVNAEGGKNVHFQYLSGPRQIPMADLENFHGNPLIMAFLEQEVKTMAEELGGGRVYMRNRIRHAFFDRAETSPETISLDGRDLAATRITIRPFVGDKKSEQIGRFEHIAYEFVVANEVPGGIYSMQSALFADKSATTPLARDVITFQELK